MSACSSKRSAGIRRAGPRRRAEDAAGERGHVLPRVSDMFACVGLSGLDPPSMLAVMQPDRVNKQEVCEREAAGGVGGRRSPPSLCV